MKVLPQDFHTLRRKQKRFTRSTSILVTKEGRCNSKQMQDMHPLQNVRKKDKSNLPSTENIKPPLLNGPNENILLDFIKPITGNHHQFYFFECASNIWQIYGRRNGCKVSRTLCSTEWYRKQPEQTKLLHLRAAFSHYFLEKHYIEIIYRTPYRQTITGLVERGVRTLIEISKQYQSRQT